MSLRLRLNSPDNRNFNGQNAINASEIYELTRTISKEYKQ